MLDALDRAASGDRGLTFVTDEARATRVSYAELAERVQRRARQLRASGVSRGDRVALVVPDNEEFAELFLGAMAAGAVPVPMYPPVGFVRIHRYERAAAAILRSARPRVAVVGERLAAGMRDRFLRLDVSVPVTSPAELPAPVSGEPPRPRAEEPAFLQYTSGSTGLPRGVVITHASLIANLSAIAGPGLAMSADDVTVSWLPMYHDMGLIGFLLTPIFAGSDGVLIPPMRFARRPSVWMEMMHRYRGTISFAPNFGYAVAARRARAEEARRLDLSRVRVLGAGAEPNHRETLETFLDRFAPAGLGSDVLMPCYGLAESTLAVTFAPRERPLRVDRIDPDAYRERSRAEPSAASGAIEVVSCGRPFPGHDVRILDDAGRALPERRVGEIVTAGPSLAAGYFEDGEATRETFGERGLYTGDLGYLAEGELYVTGRKKDLIIVGGRNYDPQAIEWAAAEVDGVRQDNVVAFSIPGADTESVVVAAEARSRGEELAEQVRDHIREELLLDVADVVMVPPGRIPKTSSGKLQRHAARRLYLDGEWERER